MLTSVSGFTRRNMLFPRSCLVVLRSPVSSFKRLGIIRRNMSSSAADEVLFQRSGDVGIIQLNRPKALNALNLNMVKLMNEKLKEWENQNLKLVVCKGSGDKAFCAGGDIVAICKAGKSGDKLSSEFFKQEYILDHRIATLKPVYVALIHGITMGGGVGISVHGRYRVATEKTMFAMPETAIGFLTDVGGSYFLPRLKNDIGMYLALTGNRITGREVQTAGITTHFVNSSSLPQLENELTSLKNISDQSVRSLLDSYDSKSSSASSTSKGPLLSELVPRVKQHFHRNSVEEIFSSLGKENSEWSKQILDTLGKMSPSSLKIVYRLIHEGSKMSLPECLSMEYRVSQRILKGTDFYEGVRSKLIDKDNQPKWNPTRLEDITEKDIDEYFKPFSNPADELRIA